MGVLVAKIEAVSKLLPPARDAVTKATGKVGACDAVMQRLTAMKASLQASHHAAMLAKPLVKRRSRPASASASSVSSGDSDDSPTRIGDGGYTRLSNVDVSDGDSPSHGGGHDSPAMAQRRLLHDPDDAAAAGRVAAGEHDADDGPDGTAAAVEATTPQHGALHPGDVGPVVSKMDAWNLRLLGDRLKQTDAKLQRATDEWKRYCRIVKGVVSVVAGGGV